MSTDYREVGLVADGAEESVLSGVLINPSATAKLAAILKPDDFADEKRQWVWEAALALMEQNAPIDFLTVCDEMDAKGRLQEVGGPAYVTDLINAAPTSVHAEHYARIVAHLAERRRLLDAAGDVAKLACDKGQDLPDVRSRSLEAVVGAHRANGDGPVIARDATSAEYDRQEAVCRHGDSPPGVPTGYGDLDKLIRFHNGELTYLAARPSQGKTSLALSVSSRACKRKEHVAFFSLEMSVEALTMRLVSAETGITFTDIRDGKVGARWDAYVRALDEIGRWPLWIIPAYGLTPSELRAHVMRLDMQHGIDLVVVDYLQLMNTDGQQPNLYHAATANSKALKRITADLGLPFLVLSQLSRAVEQRQDKRPVLSDLRDSGGIEQDADVVAFIYRDEVYDENTERKNLADIIVAKNRNGPTGSVALYFKKQSMTFLDAEVRRTDLNGGEML